MNTGATQRKTLVIVETECLKLVFIMVAGYFIISGKSPASKIVLEISVLLTIILLGLISCFLLSWRFADCMTDKLEEEMLVNLAQIILIFIGVAVYFYFTEKPEEVSHDWKSGFDAIRQILVAISVLLPLVVLRPFFYFPFSWLITEKIITRHLLDLSEAERWRYIEARDRRDLEEQMKILRGRKDDAVADKSGFKSRMRWK